MTGEPDKDNQAEAIDADFEPAPAADYILSEKSQRAGPGWVPVGSVAIIAAGALGFSVWSHFDAEDNSRDFDSTKLAALEAAQTATKQDLLALRSAAEETDERMAAQIESLLTGGENGDGLEALVAELESVSERMDAAMSENASAAEIMSLEARLDALEGIDEGEAITQRDVRASIVALGNRVEQIVSQNEENSRLIESQANKLRALSARIEDFEFSQLGESASVSVDQANLLANLESELQSLKTTVKRGDEIDQENDQRFSEILSSLQAANESVSEQDAAFEKAAMAFSNIEAAAEKGREFEADYRVLRELMPEDADILKFARFAQKTIPTVLELTARFEGDKDAALEQIKKTSSAGWGWTQRVFGNGVTVRRAGDAGDAQEMLEIASVQLESGDFLAAITAIQQINGEPGKIMADWLMDAELRWELDQAINTLRAKLNERGQ